MAHQEHLTDVEKRQRRGQGIRFQDKLHCLVEGQIPIEGGITMQDIKAIIVRNELKAYVMEKRAEQRELEKRYNPYHDPKNECILYRRGKRKDLQTTS